MLPQQPTCRARRTLSVFDNSKRDAGSDYVGGTHGRVNVPIIFFLVGRAEPAWNRGPGDLRCNPLYNYSPVRPFRTQYAALVFANVPGFSRAFPAGKVEHIIHPNAPDTRQVRATIRPNGRNPVIVRPRQLPYCPAPR